MIIVNNIHLISTVYSLSKADVFLIQSINKKLIIKYIWKKVSYRHRKNIKI